MFSELIGDKINRDEYKLAHNLKFQNKKAKHPQKSKMNTAINPHHPEFSCTTAVDI